MFIQTTDTSTAPAGLLKIGTAVLKKLLAMVRPKYATLRPNQLSNNAMRDLGLSRMDLGENNSRSVDLFGPNGCR